MKRFLTCLIMAGLISSGLLAKEPHNTDKTMALNINPLSMILLTYSGSYGFSVSDRIALIIPFGVTYISGGVSLGNSTSSSYMVAPGFGLGARFYLTDKVFNDAFYIQPTLEGAWFYSGNTNAFGISVYAMLGYSWVWNSGFMLNLAAGPRYRYINVRTDSADTPFGLSGILPEFEFSLGYAW